MAVGSESEVHEVESFGKFARVGRGGCAEVVVVHGHRDDSGSTTGEAAVQIGEVARHVTRGRDPLVALIDDDVGPRDVHRGQSLEHGPRCSAATHGYGETALSLYRDVRALRDEVSRRDGDGL